MEEKKFSEQVREAIASTGKTMKEVSELIGVPYRTIQDYRAGRHEPSSNITKEAVLKRITACGEIWTADRETGTLIDQFETLNEAKEAIKRYEANDKEEDNYTEDFYNIVDGNHHTIG